MTTRTILGIDPGTKEMGIVVLRGEELLEYGVHTLRNGRQPYHLNRTGAAADGRSHPALAADDCGDRDAAPPVDGSGDPPLRHRPGTSGPSPDPAAAGRGVLARRNPHGARRQS